jgi:ubiquilin
MRPTSAVRALTRVTGPSELKLQIAITADKSVLDLKNAIASQSDVEAGRQRLIYSGALSSSLSLSILMHTRRPCLEGAYTTPPMLSRSTLTSSTQDDDLLSTYKIKTGNTVHMVKGAAPGAAAAASTGAPAAAIPTMQTGQNPLDPLTQLNSHRGFGAMAGVNPFADMGLNPNDPNMVRPAPCP